MLFILPLMRITITIVFLLHSLALLAQSGAYNFSKLDIHSGLSNNQVNTILKDADGFLWFGTVSGLNRYDGYACKVFTNQHNDTTSLPDNTIAALYELPHGRMWVDTREGPAIYDTRTEQFDKNTNYFLNLLGLPSGTITAITKGNEQTYWFLYNNGKCYRYSASWKKASPLAVTSLQTISNVCETKEGKLWVVYQNGLLQCIDVAANKLLTETKALQGLSTGRNNNYNLFIDTDGDLWIWSFSKGAYLYRPTNNVIKPFNETSTPSLNSNLISRIVQDNNGLIWIATDHGGVNLVNKKDLSVRYIVNNPKDAGSLSQNSVNALYKDDLGIIWLGTYKQGVNYLNGNIIKFPHYYHDESNTNSLQYDDVNRFVEDKNGNLWIGTNGGGLIYFDRKTNRFKQYLHEPANANSLSNNVIVSLWIDHTGLLWIGTFYGGLSSFDGSRFTHYKHNDKDATSLADDKVWEIFEDKEQRLWVGTLGAGLDLFDRNTKQFKHFQTGATNAPLRSNYIAALVQDKKGNLWIGTVAGVAVFTTDGKNLFYAHTTDKTSLSNNNVISLLEDSKGTIWVGTRQGLNRFNEQTKTFQTFTTADGLPDNAILTILEDNQQRLWLTTPNGLCNMIPKEQGYTFINYDEMNNLQNREFNENAAAKTSNGELIVGGPSGFNIIDPKNMQQPVYHSKIIFTGLQILNKNVESGQVINDRVLLTQTLSHLQAIELKHQENVFTIEFASLGFARTARDKYAYMMEGFNSDWLYTDGNNRRATYTNLDPGRYHFAVKVQHGDGTWSKIKLLEVRILPPFWKTPLAYIIYIIIAAGLFFLARRIVLERIHMRFEVRQQRREAERAHALEQLKTKFFTNVSHEFRTPLSLIISPLDRIIKETTDSEQKKQLNLVHRNARRLLNLVNQLLDFRKMEVQEMKLHPAIGDIVRFTNEICNSFTDIAEKKQIDFSFTSGIDSLEIYFDKDKIEKILFNLLSNAFKYTHDHGKITCHLQYNPTDANTEDLLSIEVADSGIGIPPEMHEKIFERFFQTDVPESMVNQGTGIGLAITKEFVRLHNGVINVKSEPEKGTTFTVSIPAKKIITAAHAVHTPMPAADIEQAILEEKSDKKKTIVVVEDNEDLRFYLKDNLKAQYHVVEAVNGKEGWERIKEVHPDLVVSDVMMPIMDGIELAKKVKTETLTAHIPIILLTAMGSEEKQLEGLNVGVNDYITKPFTFEILASRIRNLLAQQKLLQKRFQKQIEVNPAEVTITPVDEQFLQQALDVVEKQIDNPDFSVEDLSRELHMSRITLYRKILSLTGKAPLEFIRSIRLKRAAQLLEKSGRSVAEIAYDVGFNNPKLFSKAFKEEFKVTPTAFRDSTT